jgi:hypothetical protein
MMRPLHPLVRESDGSREPIPESKRKLIMNEAPCPYVGDDSEAVKISAAQVWGVA